MKSYKQRYKIGCQLSVVSCQILKKSVFTCVYLWIISLCFFAFPIETKAQVRPVYDFGAIGLGQLLKRLNNTKSVMHIGAHPDDEDSGLLAYLARGENARTAYLSLTRGDGGQNIIGSELFESLGVIRTEELLQARRLDGAEQYFTRAFDYGFSKTLAEAKSKWDEKIVLCDAVRAIRQFRPQVVISRFSGTPADGHGQHQYAGYIAPLAVKAASDANQCKDAGAPWQVLKFYVGQGFRSTEKPTLSLNTGQYDSLLGRSYFEIAMEGRSQHKTQEQGVLELKGERFSGLNLIESKVPKVENETSVFDGISAKIGDLLSFGKQESLTSIQASAAKALIEYQPANPQNIVPILMEGYKAFDQAFFFHNDCDEKNEADFLRCKINAASVQMPLRKKQEEFFEAIKLAAGIQIDALSNTETVASNETFSVTTNIYFPNAANIKVKEINLNAPNNWQVSKADAPKDTNQGFFRREVANQSAYFTVKVPKDAKLTAPFWMEKPRQTALFDLSNNENIIEPFQNSLISADIKIEVDGAEITLNQPVEFRYADDIRGEVRRDLNVVPKVSLKMNQDLLIVPQNSRAQIRTIKINVRNNSSQTFSGTVDLILPNGWKTHSKFAVFSLNKKDENTSVEFEVEIPANARNGNYEIKANVKIGEEIFTQTMQTLAYPHINTHRFYTETTAKVKSFDLKVAPAKIGYIMGSGDAVPDAIRQMNLPVEMLGETDLTSGDLSKFDTIVVGIRAFQVRPDLISNNQRLMNYVKNGGKLIVQYQRPEYESLLPFPAKLGARVTDENAKMTILDPANPIFNFPNKITDKDFENWVQERNLYAFSTFDANYKPLLETHDANEAENKGGLVVAEIGKGKYVYCSYAFFRQLPAGVPGAYRIFANLLALK